ncbi:hypothetical protein ECZU29_00060 [Escherichia coli]|nr:hypothetical protein ECZU29_00060 [Escherichia coli]
MAFQPEGATDKSFRAVSSDKTKATVSVSGMTITVNGVAAGKVNIPVYLVMVSLLRLQKSPSPPVWSRGTRLATNGISRLMKRQAEQAESDSGNRVYCKTPSEPARFWWRCPWHNHPQKTKLPSMNEAVKQIEQEVLTGPQRQFLAAERVRRVRYVVVNDAPEQAEDAGPAEPVSAESVFDGELSFALKLAREMGRPDWRAMLAGMSSTGMPTGTAFTVPIIFMMFCWICTFPG